MKGTGVLISNNLHSTNYEKNMLDIYNNNTPGMWR